MFNNEPDDIWCDLCGQGMKTTTVLVRGREIDCCSFCKSLTIEDSYPVVEENKITEVYGE